MEGHKECSMISFFARSSSVLPRKTPRSDIREFSTKLLFAQNKSVVVSQSQANICHEFDTSKQTQPTIDYKKDL